MRAGEVGEHDLEVAAVFPQELTAGAARRRQVVGIGDDGDAGEDRVTFGERLDQRDALGAERQAVGRVLDVAAGDDVPSAVSSAAPTLKCEYRACANCRAVMAAAIEPFRGIADVGGVSRRVAPAPTRVSSRRSVGRPAFGLAALLFRGPLVRRHPPGAAARAGPPAAARRPATTASPDGQSRSMIPSSSAENSPCTRAATAMTSL